MPRPFRPRGAPVVERVLEVTLEELGRVGLARLSLPRVAELAGIHKTSLYRRWPTKDVLVAAALALAVPSETALPERGSLVLDLVALARTLGAFLGSPAGAGLMRTVIGDADATHVRRLSRAMWPGDPSAGPRAVLERAIARGELGADADLDALLFTLAGAVLHRVLVEQKPTDRRWATRIATLLVDGARPRASRRAPHRAR